MKAEKTYNVEASIINAYLLKYGYIGLIIVSSAIIFYFEASILLYLIPICILFSMSIHIIVAAYLFKDHYICMIQGMNRSVMDPTVKYDYRQQQSMKRDGYFIGVFFILLGIAFIIVIVTG